MAKAFVAFLIFVVLLFVLPGMLPGLLAAAGPLLLVGLLLLAVLFVPSIRRLAIGLLVFALIGAYAVSALSSGYRAARTRVAAAAGVPGSSFEALIRAFITEDWRPFIVATSWQPWRDPPCCIHAGDVWQGRLGDCWLLAALAAVARTNPMAIKNAIQANPDGSYTVTLYVSQNGKLVPRGVTVAPPFPEYPTTILQQLRVTTRESRFPYAQPGDDPNEAWVMLIEKAAATLYGSYEKLDAGSGFDGLQMVTGRKVTAFEPRQLSQEALATKLVELEQARVPVVAGTFALDKIIESGPNPLLVGSDATLTQQHMYYFVGYDPATRRVTVGNQHLRNKTNVLTLQEFQFAFTGVFYNDLRTSGDGCTCS